MDKKFIAPLVVVAVASIAFLPVTGVAFESPKKWANGCVGGNFVNSQKSYWVCRDKSFAIGSKEVPKSAKAKNRIAVDTNATTGAGSLSNEYCSSFYSKIRSANGAKNILGPAVWICEDGQVGNVSTVDELRRVLDEKRESFRSK